MSDGDRDLIVSKNGFVTTRMQSERMKAVTSTDTKAEVLLRKAVWGAGARYRKNDSSLPGRPDITFRSKRLAVFVDGEFWHGQDWVRRKARLRHNRAYWVAKIERNMQRDRECEASLEALGYAVIRFWTKDILRDPDQCASRVLEALADRATGPLPLDAPRPFRTKCD